MTALKLKYDRVSKVQRNDAEVIQLWINKPLNFLRFAYTKNHSLSQSQSALFRNLDSFCCLPYSPDIL